MRRWVRPGGVGALALVLVATAAACGGGDGAREAGRASESSPPSASASSGPPSSTGEPTAPAPDTAAPASGTAAPAPAPVIVDAVGDIGTCGSDDDEAVADLVEPDVAAVLTLGDTAYPSGSPDDFTRCFEPGWGPLRDRLHPVPGNHDVATPGAAGYFGWFGAAAGDPPDGYQSFDLGGWHVVGLNSNCGVVGGCGPGSPQEQWFRADLAASDARCTLVYWHAPRWSAGPHGDDADVDALWRDAAELGVDVVLAGHDHIYERFAPLDADGSPAADGLRSFVVGTGGAPSYQLDATLPATLEVGFDGEYGLLRLELGADGYAWRFLPAPGGAQTDTGSASCR